MSLQHIEPYPFCLLGRLAGLLAVSGCWWRRIALPGFLELGILLKSSSLCFSFAPHRQHDMASIKGNDFSPCDFQPCQDP
jgi:hypothetical protein